ncbi:MAG: regulatory protein RecX [Gammaproteobacteria bacterium]|nr:recombination regulator RecX [Gammaproteobacteria bacterium]MDE2460798.1 regulatory protein RecX [Gammaproteobacteria bacterium]
MSLSKPRKPEGKAARDPARIRAAALRLLARREHSAQELTAKLLARGFEAQPVAEVVAALTAKNLVSDARFVDEFVAARLRRGSGPAKICEELRGRGVEQGLVNSALADHRENWLATAEAARRKRFGAALPRDFQERARQARFLQQRGFTAEQIRQVMKGDIEEL